MARETGIFSKPNPDGTFRVSLHGLHPLADIAEYVSRHLDQFPKMEKIGELLDQAHNRIVQLTTAGGIVMVDGALVEANLDDLDPRTAHMAEEKGILIVSRDKIGEGIILPEKGSSAYIIAPGLISRFGHKITPEEALFIYYAADGSKYSRINHTAAPIKALSGSLLGIYKEQGIDPAHFPSVTLVRQVLAATSQRLS